MCGHSRSRSQTGNGNLQLDRAQCVGVPCHEHIIGRNTKLLFSLDLPSRSKSSSLPTGSSLSAAQNTRALQVRRVVIPSRLDLVFHLLLEMTTRKWTDFCTPAPTPSFNISPLDRVFYLSSPTPFVAGRNELPTMQKHVRLANGQGLVFEKPGATLATRHRHLLAYLLGARATRFGALHIDNWFLLGCGSTLPAFSFAGRNAGD